MTYYVDKFSGLRESDILIKDSEARTAITGLQSDLSDEETARINADTALGNSISDILTTISNKIYDVRDFGIFPNSNNDEYEHIYDMLHNTVAQTGGYVFFPKGEYLTSDCIFIPSNTVLIGEGPATIITYTEQYTYMGIAVTNGGNNCGVMNMRVNSQSTEPIISGSLAGSIGFSLWDFDSVLSYHDTEHLTKSNHKNAFAINIWSDTRFVLQSETLDDTLQLDGVTYHNINAPKSMVSVQGRGAKNIANVNISNVNCAFLRFGASLSLHSNQINASNVSCGLAWLQGDINITNLLVDEALKHDYVTTSHAVSIAGNVKITNCEIKASTVYSHLFNRGSGLIMINNAYGKSLNHCWVNAIGTSEATFNNVYLTGCRFEAVDNGNSFYSGIGSASTLNIDSGTIRNRNVKTTTPTLNGSNVNVSSGTRASKLRKYDDIK